MKDDNVAGSARCRRKGKDARGKMDQPSPKMARRKRPTIRDVALEAGMSLVTVSRVINNHPSVKKSTRARVEKAMRLLDYQPDASAQNMRRDSTRTVGFLMPDFANGVNATIAQTVGVIMQKAGYTLLLACSDYNPDFEIEALRKFRQQRVDGIILQTTNEQDADILRTVAQTECPIVLIDRDMEVEADRVLTNHAPAMRSATRLLLDLGHRDIGLIAAERGIRPGRERVEAFREEMAAAGIAVPPERIFATGETLAHGYRATVEMIMGERPTAIIAGGNQIVYGAMLALREFEVDIPREVSIIGADHRNLSAVSIPRLTFIDRNLVDIGKYAATMLIDRIVGRWTGAPRRQLLPASVMLNDSCARVPRAAAPTRLQAPSPREDRKGGIT